MYPPFGPVALTIGPFELHWYGILIVTGIFLGAMYAARQAPQRGIAADHIWNGLVIVVILGIVGARLYHVFSSPQGGGQGWPWYREHPLDILKVWEGGLGIYGAIIGGLVGIVVYARYHHLPLLTLLDLGAPGLALGQAIGRWGNFFNQEVYGPPTGSAWWGVRIDAARRLSIYPISQYPESTLFHPTWMYESLWCLALFLVLAFLVWKAKDRLRTGDIFVGYVIGYAMGRFWIEFFRPDAWMLGPLATAQWVGLALVVGAVVLFVVRCRREHGSAGFTDQEHGLTDREAGSAGLTDQEAGLAGLTDREAGLAGLTDREAGSAGLTDREVGLAGLTDREAGSAGLTDREAGSAGSTDREAQSTGESVP